MEYHIESIFVDTENLMRQAYGKILRKKQILWTAVMIVLGVLFAFIGIILNKTAYLLGAVAYAAMAVWYLLWPYRAGRKAYKNMLKYYDGTIPEVVVRFGETITFTQRDSVTTIPYNKLKQVSILKDGVMLHNELGGGYVVANGGFTKGSKQEMLALLREKCPNAKLPDWQW